MKKKGLDVYSYTNKGGRDINQDSILCKTGRTSVFCVADGMGGHSHGELASREIVTRLEECFVRLEEDAGFNDYSKIIDSYEKALYAANEYIFNNYNRGVICGSTAVVLIICQGRYTFFSSGDSRIYRKERLRIIQITSDDVWQNTAEAYKLADNNEIRRHHNYGKLTKAIGSSERTDICRVSGELRKRDRFLLCSDGVYKYIPEKILNKAFTDPAALNSKLERIKNSDNWSYIAVSCK